MFEMLVAPREGITLLKTHPNPSQNPAVNLVSQFQLVQRKAIEKIGNCMPGFRCEFHPPATHTVCVCVCVSRLLTLSLRMKKGDSAMVIGQKRNVYSEATQVYKVNDQGTG